MRTATTVEGSSDPAAVDFVVEAERLGLDECWVAEAWGSDAPSVLGFLAARTERIRLGSGVIQVGTRTPVAIAQAALTLDALSGGRFALGLGSSGPGVACARCQARRSGSVSGSVACASARWISRRSLSPAAP